MKKLTCEMCGSTDLIKEDGVFVCQSCGTKYSVEEAKKMMVEGIVEVQGTVQIDSSNKVENLIKNAKVLYKDGKIDEAYKILGEVLNINAENYVAIVYRGFCSAWTTTVVDLKHIDVIKGISRGLELALKDLGESKEYADFCLECVDEIEKIGQAWLNLCKDYAKDAEKRYREAAHRVKTHSLNNDPRQFMDTVNSYYNVNKDSIEALELTHKTLNVIMEKIIVAEGEIYDVKDYKKIRKIIDGYKIILEQELEKKLRESMLLLPFICDNDKKVRETIDETIGGYKMILEKELKKSMSLISICDNKIKNLTNKKRENYWIEHKEEKIKFESELNKINSERDNIEKEYNKNINEINILKDKMNASVPSEVNKMEILEKIKKLQREKEDLGIFKGKEKKAIQEKINLENEKVKELEIKIKNEKEDLANEYNPQIKEYEDKNLTLEDQIEKLDTRKEEIENELKKDR